MQTLFQRKCTVVVGTPEEAIRIEGLRIKFEVRKQLLGFPNTAVIEIFNLSPTTRDIIGEKGNRVELQAGFERAQTLFIGEVVNSNTVRENPDTITTIWARDSYTAYARATTSRSFLPGVDVKQMVQSAIQDFRASQPEIMQGAIEATGVTTSAEAFAGKTSAFMDKLAKKFGFNWSFDDGVLQVTPEEGVNAKTPLVVVSKTSGMIGSPALTEIGADVNMVLNPLVTPNGPIQVVSDFAKINLGNLLFRPINKTIGEGLYRVNEVTHRGDTRGSDWISQVIGRKI